MARLLPEATGPARVCPTAYRLSSLCIRSLAVAALFCVISLPAVAGNVQSRKQEAWQQFQKAEQMREALNGRPQAERTRRDYLYVANAYRKVYYLSPASSKADDSVMAVAEMLAAMGHQFQPGEKDLRSAIGQYKFLRREYPGSKYRMEALFTIGQIYKEDLDDSDAARATFEEFLRRYPHDERAEQAKEALAELDLPKAKGRPAQEVAQGPSRPASSPQGATPEVASTAAVEKTGPQHVTGIRHWSSPDSSRVAIDVDGPVEYQVGRVPDPDRIFFDLSNTKLVSTLVGKSFEVDDGLLKKIRIAQYTPDSTRVVLEVQDLSEYSAFILPNPYRLIIDVHGRQAETPVQVTGNSPGETGGEGASQSKANETSSRSLVAGNIPPAGEDRSASGQPAKSSDTAVAKRDEKASSRPAEVAAALPSKKTQPTRTVVEADDEPQSPAQPEGGNLAGGNLSKPTSAPTAVALAPKEKSGKKSAKSATRQNLAAHEAAPTSAGDRSLIRALGLKIGRIVIDPGHGGHDTGTIGPKGLMEKDLVLDVSLRLGRLLEMRLGADVVYTRDDDTFVPLETRTAIANEQQADLFISVHANSSPNPSARGIETYYLNFTTNADALEVAARENAVSDKSIHELQDLVKKITLKEKIEESRELASDVQQSLYSGLAGRNSSLRNRGVKKAPFVVLIGANMPSILAEISFVSNPTDERKLQTPEYRQKIAEALYKGIAKYVGGLSGVKVASKMSKESGD